MVEVAAVEEKEVGIIVIEVHREGMTRTLTEGSQEAIMMMPLVVVDHYTHLPTQRRPIPVSTSSYDMDLLKETYLA